MIRCLQNVVIQGASLVADGYGKFEKRAVVVDRGGGTRLCLMQ